MSALLSPNASTWQNFTITRPQSIRRFISCKPAAAVAREPDISTKDWRAKDMTETVNRLFENVWSKGEVQLIQDIISEDFVWKASSNLLHTASCYCKAAFYTLPAVTTAILTIPRRVYGSGQGHPRLEHLAYETTWLESVLLYCCYRTASGWQTGPWLVAKPLQNLCSRCDRPIQTFIMKWVR
jgi:hypothetical protein